MERDDGLLAVDLGRSRCRVALWDGGHCRTAEGAGAPGLASPGGADRALAAIVAAARPLIGTARVATVSAGAPGALAAPDAARALAGLLCGALGAERAVVGSDAVMAHAGALGGGPGVVLVVGTGAAALAAWDGPLRRVDGAGPWLGDVGGGAWLGLRGLRAVLRAADGRGPATPLQRAAEARFGPLAGLPAVMEADANPPRLAAGFAPDVLAAATAGDPVATGLVRQAAAALAGTLRAAASGLPRPAAAAIVGGLAPLLARAVRAALAGHRLDFAAAPGTALDGARLLARHGGLHEAGLARAARGQSAPVRGAPPTAPDLAPDFALDGALPLASTSGPHLDGPAHAAGGPGTGATPEPALDILPTEAVRPGLDDLDQRSPAAIVHLLLAAERAATDAMARAAPALAAAAEAVATRMRAGGRLFTLGAGTPGRLAVLDATELGPTYNAPPGLVVPLLAGGVDALVRSAEGAEDDPGAAAAALDAHGLTAADAVVGIAASGRTPYVVGGLRHARARGALTVAVVNNPGSPAAAAAELAVEILTGPEVIAGSTRMLAGTAQKVALNAISTAAMVALGRTYGARMVDVRATNAKLRRRALRMVQDITGAPEDAAADALAAADGEVKPAVVALLAGVDAAEAGRRLHRAGGRVREALAG